MKIKSQNGPNKLFHGISGLQVEAVLVETNSTTSG